MSPHVGRFSLAAVLPLALVLTYGEPVERPAPREQSNRSVAAAAPRPAIISRSAWHSGRAAGVHEHTSHGDAARAVFIHHTDGPSDYRCGRVPRTLQSLQADHIHSKGWDDVGYNFLVDRCGTIYEGRAGSADRNVTGAHTSGFNRHSLGIAAVGTYKTGPVPKAMLRAIAALIAWKLRPGIDPRGTTQLRSASSESRFHKGTLATFNVVSGHRDAYATSCPGKALYHSLPQLRRDAYRLRGS